MFPLSKCQAAGTDSRAETMVVNQLGKKFPSSSGLCYQETESKKEKNSPFLLLCWVLGHTDPNEVLLLDGSGTELRRLGAVSHGDKPSRLTTVIGEQWGAAVATRAGEGSSYLREGSVEAGHSVCLSPHPSSLGIL